MRKPRGSHNLWRAKLATVLALVALPATAVAADRAVNHGSPPPRASQRGPADIDVREGLRGVRPDARMRAAQRRLRRSLGPNALLELDRDTGTPAIVGRRVGFLTPPQ